jgi:hypothetical protein
MSEDVVTKLLKLRPYKVVFCHQTVGRECDIAVGFRNLYSIDFLMQNLHFILVRSASPSVAADNRHAVHEMPMHDLEVGVWCAISERRIIRGQHFQRNNKLQKLCEINYVTLLPSTQRNKYSYRNFMRDNATAHSESYFGDSASPPPLNTRFKFS